MGSAPAVDDGVLTRARTNREDEDLDEVDYAVTMAAGGCG